MGWGGGGGGGRGVRWGGGRIIPLVIFLFFYYYYYYLTAVNYSLPSNKLFVAYSMYLAFLFRPSI